MKRILIRYLEEQPNVNWNQAIEDVSNNMNSRFNHLKILKNVLITYQKK